MYESRNFTCRHTHCCFNLTELNPQESGEIPFFTISVKKERHASYVYIALSGISLTRENLNFGQKTKIQSPFLRFYTSDNWKNFSTDQQLVLRFQPVSPPRLTYFWRPPLWDTLMSETTTSPAPCCHQAGQVKAARVFLNTTPTPCQEANLRKQLEAI